MFNKIGIILSCLMFLLTSGSVLAGKPKTELFHCGCEVTNDQTEEASTSLNWKLLNVSNNGKGHLKHVTGDVEECDYSVPIVYEEGENIGDPVLDEYGMPTFEGLSDMYVRGGDDCRVSGETGPLSLMSLCAFDVPVEAPENYPEGEDCSQL